MENAIKKAEPSLAERFTSKVLGQFANGNNEIQVTEHQKQLIRGYFIKIDTALKDNEQRRNDNNAKNSNPNYNNNIPCTWQNINMSDIASDVVMNARLGLDMMQDNHLFPILFANKKTGKYDIEFMKGYNGIRYIAEKYALEMPDVTIELVYESDKFIPKKKSINNPIESYEFEVTNPFNRGKVIGGFIYYAYNDEKKNKLLMMTTADIEKRKPRYASAEFWGGEKSVYENGKKVTVQTDGWYNEMCYKTLMRFAYSQKNIPIDPDKIDENYLMMMKRESEYAEYQNQREIEEKANTITIESEDTIPPSADEPHIEEVRVEESKVEETRVEETVTESAEPEETEPNF